MRVEKMRASKSKRQWPAEIKKKAKPIPKEEEEAIKAYLQSLELTTT